MKSRLRRGCHCRGGPPPLPPPPPPLPLALHSHMITWCMVGALSLYAVASRCHWELRALLGVGFLCVLQPKTLIAAGVRLCFCFCSEIGFGISYHWLTDCCRATLSFIKARLTWFQSSGKNSFLDERKSRWVLSQWISVLEQNRIGVVLSPCDHSKCIIELLSFKHGCQKRMERRVG